MPSAMEKVREGNGDLNHDDKKNEGPFGEIFFTEIEK